MNTALRQWEYYGMQETFDKLYEESSKGKTFNRLYDLITSEKNIMLAYRTIKSNKGSKPKGTDEFTIAEYKTQSKENFVQQIRNVLKDYKPKSVRINSQPTFLSIFIE